MNGNLVKREIYFLIKNPITYLGILLMVLIVTVTIKPYLSLYNNLRMEGEPIEYASEGDIDTGYIPTPSEEAYETFLHSLHEGLIKDFNLSETQASQEIKKTRENKWGIDEIAKYMDEKYSAKGVRSLIDQKKFKHADFSEMKLYLQNVFSNKTFTESFSYKYSDFLSMGSILFAMIVFTLIFVDDVKKDIYPLLHTKPLTGREYIISKLLAGTVFIYLVIIAFTTVINIIAIKKGLSYGFKVSFWDIWKSVIVFNFPNVVLTGCLIVFITLTFRNILPAIPALLLYFVYSNMGSANPVSGYVYQVKPLVLLIRFPGEFATLTIPKGALLNQCFVITLSVILIICSISLWERRRSA